MKFRDKLRLAIRVLRARESTMFGWAEKELALAFPHDPDDPINDWLREGTAELVFIFGLQGHSGMSAPYAIEYARRLMSWTPLSPLTGKADEWMEIDAGLHQNIRCSKVFMDLRKGAYVLDGYVFEEPDGSRFTGMGSSKPITFPYDPSADKPVIVKVDDQGVPLLKKYAKLRERNVEREL